MLEHFNDTHDDRVIGRHGKVPHVNRSESMSKKNKKKKKLKGQEKLKETFENQQLPKTLYESPLEPALAVAKHLENLRKTLMKTIKLFNLICEDEGWSTRFIIKPEQFHDPYSDQYIDSPGKYLIRVRSKKPLKGYKAWENDNYGPAHKTVFAFNKLSRPEYYEVTAREIDLSSTQPLNPTLPQRGVFYPHIAANGVNQQELINLSIRKSLFGEVLTRMPEDEFQKMIAKLNYYMKKAEKPPHHNLRPKRKEIIELIRAESNIGKKIPEPPLVKVPLNTVIKSNVAPTMK